jgi:hypothetical protein
MKVSNLFLLVVAGAAEAVTKQESQVITHRQGADFDSSYLRTRNVKGTNGGEKRNLHPKKSEKNECGKSGYQTVYVEFEPPQEVELPVYAEGVVFQTLDFTTYDFTEIEDTIIQRMEDDYEGFKVSFVQEEPPPSCDYSLITIRAWDDAIVLSCGFKPVQPYPTGLLDFRGDTQCGPRNYQPGLAEQVDFGNSNKTDTAFVNSNLWKAVADFYTNDDFTLIAGYVVDDENKTETLDLVMTNHVSSPTLMYNTMIYPLALDTQFQILFFRYYLLLLSSRRLQMWRLTSLVICWAFAITTPLALPAIRMLNLNPFLTVLCTSIDNVGPILKQIFI